MRKSFENCNKIANNNLNNKGNLSEFLVSYIDFADKMGMGIEGRELVSEIPFANVLNNPDYRVDVIINKCEQSLSNNIQITDEEPTMGRRIA